MSRILGKLGALAALLASAMVLLAAPERARACGIFPGTYFTAEDTGCSFQDLRWTDWGTREVTVVMGVLQSITEPPTNPGAGRTGSLVISHESFQFNKAGFGVAPVHTLTLRGGTNLKDLKIYTSPLLNVPYDPRDANPSFTLILSVHLGTVNQGNQRSGSTRTSPFWNIPLTVTVYNDQLDEGCPDVILERPDAANVPICSFTYSRVTRTDTGSGNVTLSSNLTNFTVLLDTKERVDLTLIRAGNNNKFSLAYKQGATVTMGVRTVTIYRGLGSEGLLLKENVVTFTAAQAVHSGGRGSCQFREFNPGEKTVAAVQPGGNRTITVINSYATECKGKVQIAIGEGLTGYSTIAWPISLTLRSRMAEDFRLSEEDDVLSKDLDANDHSFTLVINHQAKMNAQSKSLYTVAMPLSVHKVVWTLNYENRRTVFSTPSYISLTVSLANRVPAPSRFPLGRFQALNATRFALNIGQFWFNDAPGTSLTYTAAVISGPSNDANVNGWLNQGGDHLAGTPVQAGTYVYGVRASDGGSEVKIRSGAAVTLTTSDPLTVTIEVVTGSQGSFDVYGRQSVVLAENDSLTLPDINERGILDERQSQCPAVKVGNNDRGCTANRRIPVAVQLAVSKEGNANHASKLVGFTFPTRTEIINGDSTPFTIRQNLQRPDGSRPIELARDYYVMYVRGQSSGQCPRNGRFERRQLGGQNTPWNWVCIVNGQIVRAAGTTVTLDYETKSAYTLTIKTYAFTANGAPHTVFGALGTITISVTNLNDHPHTLSIGGGALPINEGTLSAGQTVFTGYRMRIIDRDGSAFAHDISFNQPGFQLRGDRIEVVGPATLDYERGDGLLRVNVSDAAAYDYSGNRRSTVAVLTLGLRDVRENEPVVAVKGYQAVAEVHEDEVFALDLNRAFIAGSDNLTFTATSNPALSGMAVANGILRVTPSTPGNYVISVVAAATVAPVSRATVSFTLHVRNATVSLAGQLPSASIDSLTGFITPSVNYAEASYLHARDGVKYTNLSRIRDSFAVVSVTLSKQVREVVSERGRYNQIVSRTITVTKVTVVEISGFDYNRELIQVLDNRIDIDFSDLRTDGSAQWIRGFFIKPGSRFALDEFTSVNVGGSTPQQKKIITIVLNSTIQFSAIKNRTLQSLMAEGFFVARPSGAVPPPPRRAYAVMTINTQPGIELEGTQVALSYPGGSVVDTGLTLVAAAPAGNVVFSVNIDAIKLTSTAPATVRRQAVRLDLRANELPIERLSTAPCGGHILPVTARVETGGNPSTSSNQLAFTLRFNHNLVDGNPNLVGQGVAVVATNSLPRILDTGYEFNCAAPGLEATFNPDLFGLASGTSQRRAILFKRQADISGYLGGGLTATVTYKQASNSNVTFTSTLVIPVVAAPTPTPLVARNYSAPHMEVGEKLIVELSRLFTGGGDNITYSSTFRPWNNTNSQSARPSLGSALSNPPATFANGLFTYTPTSNGYYQVAIVARAGNARATSTFTLVVLPASASNSPRQTSRPALNVRKAPRLVIGQGMTTTTAIHTHQPGDLEYVNAGTFLQKSYFEVTLTQHFAGRFGGSWSWYTILLMPKERYNEQVVRVFDNRFGIDASSVSTQNGNQIIPGIYVKPGAVFNSSSATLTMRINRGVNIDTLLDSTLQNLVRDYPHAQVRGDTQVAGAYLNNINFGYATVTMAVAAAPSVGVTGTQVSINIQGTGDVDSGLDVVASTDLGSGATLDFTFMPDVFKIAALTTTAKNNDLLVDMAKLANATLSPVMREGVACGLIQLDGSVYVEDKDDISSPTVAFSITVRDVNNAAANATPDIGGGTGAVSEGRIAGTTLTDQVTTGLFFTCANRDFTASFTNPPNITFGYTNGSIADQRRIVLKQGSRVNHVNGEANALTSTVTFWNNSATPITATITIAITPAMPPALVTTDHTLNVSLVLNTPATIDLAPFFTGGYNGIDGVMRTYAASVDPAVSVLMTTGSNISFVPIEATIHNFTVIATERTTVKATATFALDVRGEVALVERMATDVAMEVARSSSGYLLRGIASRADRGPRGGNAFAPDVDPSAVEQFGQMLLNKRSELEEGDIDLREFLTGQSFSLPLAARGEGFGSGLGVWGQANMFQVKRDATDYSYDGPLFSGMLGFDMTTGDALYGVAIGYHSGEIEQEKRGDAKAHIFENRISTVAPYLALGFGNSSLLGMAGAGVGSIKIKDQADDSEVLQESDTQLVFYSLGYSYYLGDDRWGVKFKSAVIGNELVAKGDAATEYPESETKNLQLRLALEMVGHIEMGAGRLSPSLELAGLSDSYEVFVDDGYPNANLEYIVDDRHNGYEAIVKLEYDSGNRLRLALDASILGVPSNDYTSYGGGLGLVFAAAPGSLGLGFDIAPQYGNLSSGAIYEMESLRDFSRQDRDYSLSATSSVGYGFALPGRVMQPYLSHQLQGDRSEHILGVRLYDRGQRRWQLQYLPSKDDALMLEYRLGD